MDAAIDQEEQQNAAKEKVAVEDEEDEEDEEEDEEEDDEEEEEEEGEAKEEVKTPEAVLQKASAVTTSTQPVEISSTNIVDTPRLMEILKSMRPVGKGMPDKIQTDGKF